MRTAIILGLISLGVLLSLAILPAGTAVEKVVVDGKITGYYVEGGNYNQGMSIGYDIAWSDALKGKIKIISLLTADKTGGTDQIGGTSSSSAGIGAFSVSASQRGARSLNTGWNDMDTSIDMGTSPTGLILFFFRMEWDGSYDPYYIRLKETGASNYWPNSTGSPVSVSGTHWMTVIILVDDDMEDEDIDLQVYASGNTGLMEYEYSYVVVGKHSHADGSYATVDHKHSDGTYDVNSTDIDNISISDGVGEGSENASNVAIHLDYYNGSSWEDDKVTITPSPSATIDTDVDLSSGGTYPNETGLWRVRIFTDNSNPDYIQGIVKLKGAVDS